MPFLKKHYEKIILSIVLLGLAVAAAFLPWQVSQVREFLQTTVDGVVRTPPKPFKPLDLSTNKTVVKRFQSPVHFRFAGTHNVFNPVPWRKRPDGTLIKLQTGREIGPGALEIVRIDELKLTVEFESVSGTPNNWRYHFVVTRETDSSPRKTKIATLGTPNDLFLLTKVEGSPDAPTALELVLKADNEPIKVSKEKPYSRTIGYAAELKYPPKNHAYPRRFKVKDLITIPGDTTEKYKIVAIDQNEVTVSAESTEKRTSISSSGGSK